METESPTRAVPGPDSLTKLVVDLRSATREVESTGGKDARKARKLAEASRYLIRDLSKRNPALAVILSGEGK